MSPYSHTLQSDIDQPRGVLRCPVAEISSKDVDAQVIAVVAKQPLVLGDGVVNFHERDDADDKLTLVI